MKFSPLVLLPLLANAGWLRDVEDPARKLCEESVGGGCSFDGDCCGELKCLGVVNWECGHSPGLSGEYCNLAYPCDENCLCHEGRCKDYAELLENGSMGTCRTEENTDPNPNRFKMMTYNVFLLNCVNKVTGGENTLLACESDHNKGIRVPKLVEWFKDRDEDVVVMQELFSFQQEVIAGMAEAGFCHYVTNFQGTTGSGLGIFSKWPIESFDFVDWFDAFGNGDRTQFYNVEAIADKGVMYAKINKGGKYFHAFNTHTQSDSVGDAHPTRQVQYLRFREFVESLKIPSTEMILMGGDFNEDKVDDPKDSKYPYYRNMLDLLHAEEVPILGELQNTQDTELNNLLERLWEGTSDHEYALLLDYIFKYRGNSPANGFCEILIPQSPAGCNDAECMLSDHFPMTCNFYTGGYFDDAMLEGLPQDSYERTDQRMANGGGCGSDSDCVSDRCTYNFICEAKMPSGAACGEAHHNDGDCASGECSYSWGRGWYCE